MGFVGWKPVLVEMQSKPCIDTKITPTVPMLSRQESYGEKSDDKRKHAVQHQIVLYL